MFLIHDWEFGMNFYFGDRVLVVVRSDELDLCSWVCGVLPGLVGGGWCSCLRIPE